MRKYAKYCIKTSSSICFGYLCGDSNKYPNICYEIGIKQSISYISFCPLRILYNNTFMLMATSFVTNVVVVTRVHCI